MSGYFLGIFVLCSALGVMGLFSYGEGSLAERSALSVILLFVVLSPLVDALRNFDGEQTLIGDSVKIEIGEEYSDVGEAAFCKGIAKAVSEKFSIKEANISVETLGFDFQNMKAKKIKVTLSGLAAAADTKAVKKYVDEMNLGECRVEIEIR